MRSCLMLAFVLMSGCVTIRVGHAPDSPDQPPKTIAIVGFAGTRDVTPGTAESEPVFRGCLESIVDAGRVPIEGRYVHAMARSSYAAPDGGRPERVQAFGQIVGAEALLTGRIVLLPESLRVTKLIVSLWSSSSGREFANVRLQSLDGLEPYDAGRRACCALLSECNL